jgi:hypothetical protein
MLIDITGRLAELLEDGVVFPIGDNVDSQVPVHFKPLRPFPPVCDVYLWPHLRVVAASTSLPRVIKYA